MSRRAHSFTQGDLTKVFKAMVKAGASGRVEIEMPSGKSKITAVIAGAPETAEPPTDVNEWDDVK